MIRLQPNTNYPNITELEISNKVVPVLLKNKHIIITIVAISALCVVYLFINSLKNKNIKPNKVPQPLPNPIEDRSESFESSNFNDYDSKKIGKGRSKIAIPLSDTEIALLFVSRYEPPTKEANDNFQRELEICQKLASIPSHPNILKVVASVDKRDSQNPDLSMYPTIIVERCKDELLNVFGGEEKNSGILLYFNQQEISEKANEIAEIQKANPLKDRDPVTNEVNVERLNKYVFQLSSALEHMHKYGIAHGDVQSKNVFIAYDDSIRLGDFDHGRFEGESSKLRRLRTREETIQDDVMALANVIMTMEVGRCLSPFGENGHSTTMENIQGTWQLIKHRDGIFLEESTYYAFIDAIIEEPNKRELLKRMTCFDRSKRSTMASILPEIAQLWRHKQVESDSAAAAATP